MSDREYQCVMLALGVLAIVLLSVFLLAGCTVITVKGNSNTVSPATGVVLGTKGEKQ